MAALSNDASVRNHQDCEIILQAIRIARGFEMRGAYNAAKLFWALAFSCEIQLSNAIGIQDGVDQLDSEIEALLSVAKLEETDPQWVAMMRRGQQGARENRTILLTEIPEASVCRRCGEMILGDSSSGCPACHAQALTLRIFPPIYYLEPLPREQALSALASAPREMEAAMRGLNAEQLSRPSKPGEWAIRDVAWHVLVAQGLLAGRLEKMLAEVDPPLPSVPAWAVDAIDSLSTSEILQQYSSSRQATVERLSRLAAEDWWRTGQHDEFGQVTVLQQASYFAKHERSHFPQLSEIRRALGV